MVIPPPEKSFFLVCSIFLCGVVYRTQQTKIDSTVTVQKPASP
jgi:hypothetical protein